MNDDRCEGCGAESHVNCDPRCPIGGAHGCNNPNCKKCEAYEEEPE